MKLYYKFRAWLVPLLTKLMPRPNQIVFKGRNSALELCDQLAVLGYRKVLLVTDAFLSSSPMVDTLTQRLEARSVEVVLFSGVEPDPTEDQALAGVAMAQQQQTDAVLAVGGGSVLDCAKYIAMVCHNPGSIARFGGIQKFKRAGLPLAAVPTTAGTGSEVTLVAMISDSNTHTKVVVADTKMLPAMIAIDAEMMRGMPPSVTAATGMDALTHAVESYLSKGSDATSEIHAVAAVRLIFGYLHRAWNNGDDLEARDAMGSAAYYAGLAFGRTSVGYVHGIAHQLGRLCHTPHGVANAMVLPEVISAYGPAVYPRLAHLARAVAIGSPTDSDADLAKAFIAAMAQLRITLELPTKPRGLTREMALDVAVTAIREAGEFYPVPRYLSRAEIDALVDPLVSAA